jgi:hypothetical protein
MRISTADDDAVEWSSPSASPLTDAAVAARTRAFLAAAAALPPSPPRRGAAACCLQGEAAIVSGAGLVGSAEATTCVIALCFARCGSSSAALAAHLSGAKDAQPFAGLVARLADAVPGAALELSLVGAFDPRALAASRGTCEAVLAALGQQRDELRVKLVVACVGEANTRREGARSWPRVTAAAVDAATGALRGAALAEHLFAAGAVPFEVERRARLWLDGPGSSLELLPASLCGPELPASAPPELARALQGPWATSAFDCHYLLSLPDEDLLRATSTSPDAEHASYAPTMRGVLRFVLARLSDSEKSGARAEKARQQGCRPS